MTTGEHLWEVGFDDMGRAEQVRAEVARLGEGHCLTVLDTAVVVRYPDGCVTLDGEPFVVAPALCRLTLAGFFAGLALGAPPLTAPAAGALQRIRGPTGAEVRIDDDFVREVEALMRPGTSALFVLDREGEMPAILRGIRGLGGTVLKTNVDGKRAEMIQAALAAAGATILTEGRS
jgi:uncharacterized membrane protein